MARDAFSPDSKEPEYDPAEVAGLLLSTGERLIDLLGQETALLQASKTAEIGALIGEKTRLSQIFAAGWRQFHGNPAKLDALPRDVRNRLLHVAGRLNEAAVENEAVLKIGKRAAELVLAAIARALQAQRPRPIYTAERISPVPLRDQAGIGLNRSA